MKNPRKICIIYKKFVYLCLTFKIKNKIMNENHNSLVMLEKELNWTVDVITTSNSEKPMVSFTRDDSRHHIKIFFYDDDYQIPIMVIIDSEVIDESIIESMMGKSCVTMDIFFSALMYHYEKQRYSEVIDLLFDYIVTPILLLNLSQKR